MEMIFINIYNIYNQFKWVLAFYLDPNVRVNLPLPDISSYMCKIIIISMKDVQGVFCKKFHMLLLQDHSSGMVVP
jgi:hypothetical protein